MPPAFVISSISAMRPIDGNRHARCANVIQTLISRLACTRSWPSNTRPRWSRDLKRAIEVLHPVAIGETGFDFSRAAPSFEAQERAFRGQLEIAAAAGLPTIIHQRDASDALMTELDRWPSLAPIVLHSFDGTQRLADWARERGCFVGIGGLATRRSSGPLREALMRIPVDRLLLETDSPYLAPPGSREPAQCSQPISPGLPPCWPRFGT